MGRSVNKKTKHVKKRRMLCIYRTTSPWTNNSEGSVRNVEAWKYMASLDERMFEYRLQLKSGHKLTFVHTECTNVTLDDTVKLIKGVTYRYPAVWVQIEHLKCKAVDAHTLTRLLFTYYDVRNLCNEMDWILNSNGCLHLQSDGYMVT